MRMPEPSFAEYLYRKATLPDDRTKSASAEFVVIGNRNGGCAALICPLHHHVAATLAHQLEAIGFHYPADFLPGKHG